MESEVGSQARNHLPQQSPQVGKLWEHFVGHNQGMNWMQWLYLRLLHQWHHHLLVLPVQTTSSAERGSTLGDHEVITPVAPFVTPCVILTVASFLPCHPDEHWMKKLKLIWMSCQQSVASVVFVLP